MKQADTLISLGFTEGEFPCGTHICQIYSDEEERDQSILKYLLAGLEAGEKTACFSDVIEPEQLQEYLKEHNVDLSEVESAGNFTLSRTHEVYFENNIFDPQRMLSLLESFEIDSKKSGCNGCRVIGEMTSEIKSVKGGDRLLEYESKVSLLLKEHPVTAVCQYNANEFDGATIMDVLKVHPLMIVRGAVVQNPYFVPPEEFLKSQGIN